MLIICSEYECSHYYIRIYLLTLGVKRFIVPVYCEYVAFIVVIKNSPYLESCFPKGHSSSSKAKYIFYSCVELGLDLVESLAIDTLYNTLRYKSVAVDVLDQPEDVSGFRFAGQENDHLDRLLGIATYAIKNGTSSS